MATFIAARIPAVEMATAGIPARQASIPPTAQTLVIENTLAALIFVFMGGGGQPVPPSALANGAYDLIVPGQSLFVHPITSGTNTLGILVAYPGGVVPGADAGYSAIVTVSDDALPPFVGRLI